MTAKKTVRKRSPRRGGAASGKGNVENTATPLHDQGRHFGQMTENGHEVRRGQAVNGVVSR